MKLTRLLHQCLLLSTALAAISTTYDYVVVGGGSAGLVVANRLSANPNITVLVIEAGDSVFNNTDVSGTGNYGKALGTAIDWQFQTQPQTHTGGNTFKLHAGKAVGGTSTINGMSYTRMDPAQMDAWGALGNPGWDWLSFFPYYYKSEGFQIPDAQMMADGASYCSSCHGYGGPLAVGYTHELAHDNLSHVFNTSLINMGVPWNIDVNSNQQRGFMVYPRTVDTTLDVRSDAGRAFYYPVARRSNLVLVPNTYATQILWSPQTGSGTGNLTATGVKTTSNGKVVSYLARKEVIIAAGALKTPQLLELSGVGNPNILAKAGIPIALALPAVGEGLQDQINNGLTFTSTAKQAYTGERGYAAYANVTDIFGSGKSKMASDVQKSLAAHAREVANSNGGATTYEQTLSEFQTQYNLIFNKQIPMAEIIFYPSGTSLASQYWGLLPFARGSVHINSNNPLATPSINPQYWQFGWDREAQIAIAKFIRRLFATSPLKDMITGESYPGFGKVPSSAGNTVWTSWLQKNYRPNYHVLGTMAMKPREKGGAVNARLLVYGTSNVRVVDASVWPTQVTGHLVSTVYAVAEKAAVMIQGDDHV